jgi:hypothetical protein
MKALRDLVHLRSGTNLLVHLQALQRPRLPVDAEEFVVNLVEREAFGFDPIICYERHLKHVPYAVDHVELPADGGESEGEGENDEQAETIAEGFHGADSENSHVVIHDLRGVEHDEGCPGQAVDALEQEDTGNRAVDA